ncbi:hypothetical protein K435DRAFT_394657 [Dendrothele bispora CBS 962.96]|uniref:Uncharacterized protein n=1 Tax=Dendrothele bispora (strain CBS 962.96) TaxID=1314807 RepID=A0A4S8L9A2_DENBC|nr:hypothetical protein K435DRAFT_394657 [Dendrothele bispora CBS 962.96]
MKQIKNVYTFVEKNVLPTGEIQDKVPPLQIFTYEVRKILYPDLLYDQIPNLLDLLANVDRYRAFIIEKAEQAVAFDRFYKHLHTDTLGLTEKEIKDLEEYSIHAEEMRGVYIAIVTQFCELDIYQLWMTTGKLSVVWPRLTEYFPMIGDKKGKRVEPSRDFLLDLSAGEQEQLRKAGEECYDYLELSSDLAANREDKRP